MIIQIRIDDRLIHGQVAMVWSKHLNVNAILVANNEANTNDLTKMTLKMACPNSIKLLIRDIEGAKEIINDPRGKNMRILCIVRNIGDALDVIKSCRENILEVNLANCCMTTSTDEEILRLPGNSIALTRSDILVARELENILGNDFFHQLVPDRQKTPVNEVIKQLENR